jgi:predicted nucleic acid-binding protein
VYVPRAVRKEVSRKSRFRYRLKSLLRSGFLAPCEASDETNVKLLGAELDEGEAEALTQAQEKYAAFFIGDESRARAIPQKYALKPVGTVRLRARLHLMGVALPPEMLVSKLERDLRFRVSREIVAEAIVMGSEPI